MIKILFPNIAAQAKREVEEERKQKSEFIAEIHRLIAEKRNISK